MPRSIKRVSCATVLLATVLLVNLAGLSGLSAEPSAAAAQGTMKLEWMAHEFYRLTSPSGVVVLTSPWLENRDAPVFLNDLPSADLILIPNAHNDDMGNPIEVAAATGATVVAPGPLGRWLMDNGLPQAQFSRTIMGGGAVTSQDTTIKFGPNDHDNTLPNGADGGPAASFFIIFSNGPTVFFTSHATMIADLALYAEVYQPEIAILGLTDSAEFAQVARLMATNNPKLKTVIPSHITPNAPIIERARVELDKLGLGHLLVMPQLRQVYEY